MSDTAPVRALTISPYPSMGVVLSQMASNMQGILLDIREGDYVSIHYESTLHLQRILAAAKARGAKASVALNPATPLWPPCRPPA